MKRSEATLVAAERLDSMETALDVAISEAAALAGLLPNLRLQTGLSAMHGQSAFENMAHGLSRLAEARASVLAVHRELDLVRTNIGCRTVATGGREKPPETAVTLPLLHAPQPASTAIESLRA